jgi:tRNA threonylcarbamoyladenosine modification (KEOPS) complex  Pcc1 subunit
MRKLTGLVALMMSASVMAAPKLTTVPVDHVFSPNGFDSNDTTEVVVTGYLPNLCYKAPRAEVKLDENKNVADIEVKALDYSSDTTYCLEMLVPFTEVVPLGVLDKGNYDIKVNKETTTPLESKIKVVEATSDAVDDYIYASVEVVNRKSGTQTVLLEGYNPSDCLQLDEVKFVDNGSDTYSVLPKMKQVSDFCPIKPTPFTYEAELPTTLESEKVLLHVRVMDGKSVNRVITTKDYE